MMSPAATSTTSSGKAGAFDVSSLFVADKSAREESSVALADAAKKEGVEFFGSIGLNDALVKVCLDFLLAQPSRDRGAAVATRFENLTFHTSNAPAPFHACLHTAACTPFTRNSRFARARADI
jgi:hypothetical protein